MIYIPTPCITAFILSRVWLSAMTTQYDFAMDNMKLFWVRNNFLTLRTFFTAHVTFVIWNGFPSWIMFGFTLTKMVSVSTTERPTFVSSLQAGDTIKGTCIASFCHFFAMDIVNRMRVMTGSTTIYLEGLHHCTKIQVVFIEGDQKCYSFECPTIATSNYFAKARYKS